MKQEWQQSLYLLSCNHEFGSNQTSFFRLILQSSLLFLETQNYYLQIRFCIPGVMIRASVFNKVNVLEVGLSGEVILHEILIQNSSFICLI